MLILFQFELIDIERREEKKTKPKKPCQVNYQINFEEAQDLLIYFIKREKKKPSQKFGHSYRFLVLVKQHERDIRIV